MSTVRFGLYFIPEESSFYDAGSSIVGYDIRAQKQVPHAPFIDPAWVTTAKAYGFHATITDAIYIDSESLIDVENKTEDLLASLRSSNRYILKKSRVGFWHENSDQAAVHLVPNRAVELLHDLFVASIHPLGIGSEYTDRYKASPNDYFTDSPSQVKKTQLFHSPYIFDEFTPHFTCVNPFLGTAAERKAFEDQLAHHFSDIDEIEMSKISLVVKSSTDPHFFIKREFSLR